MSWFIAFISLGYHSVIDSITIKQIEMNIYTLWEWHIMELGPSYVLNEIWMEF